MQRTKKINSPIATAVLLACSSFAAMPALADNVLGYVTERDGAPLAGARVQVVGTGVSTFTDRTGRFVLRGVDSGQVELVVTYVGYDAQTTNIQVSDGGAPVAITLTQSGIDEIEVVSQRVAINDARNRYRASDSISNFLAADDIGQFVDQNVAENVQRLPGVSISRDQGEGRFVSVRGISADLSTVTINGMRIGTPEDGSRAVPLDIIPSGSVDLLEVNKVPTPDMPGDAVGGRVDIRSGSPFARQGRGRFDYRLELSHNELGGETNPAVGLNYSDVFGFGGGSENLGISVGINYQKREFESDDLEAEYDFIELNGVDVLVPIELQQRKYFVDRERLGANINLEYRATDDDRYFFDALFSRFDDAEDRQRSIIVLEDGDLVDFDGNNGRFEQVAEDGFRRRIRRRTKEQDTFAFAFRGEHIRGDWTMDYHAGHSITRESVPDEREGRFEKGGSPLDVLFTSGRGRLDFSVFDGAVADTGYLANANYVLDRVVEEPIAVDDDDTNFGANFEWSNAFGMRALTLKTGFDMRMKRKDSDVDEYELRDVPDLFLDSFTGNDPNYGLGDLGEGISGDSFISFFESNIDQFNERPQDVDENRQLRLGPDFVADEDVLAGYVMATYDIGRWRVIGGGRLERTDYSADGNEIDIDTEGAVTVNPRSVSSDYTSFLPGLHVRYEPRDDMVLRGAWTNTIARPSFSDISPRFEIDRDDLEIETGNPDLDPYEASNFDLLLDWYPGNRAIVSLGFFYKDVDNYTADFTTAGEGEFAGFEVTRPVNSLDASVTGIEANVEFGLEALSSALSGFLVGANATFLDTDFELTERPGETLRLPDAAHRTGNLYLGYEAGPLSTRLSYSYRGKVLSDIGDSPDFDVYVDDSVQLDLVASYRFTDAVEVRFEASNLTDQALELYQGSKGNSFQFEEYGRTFSVGMVGRF